jgi:glutathione synthase/RimK-type ligase-like ATP-grasp enzyme
VAILIVVDNPAAWPIKTRGVEVVSARAYISLVRYSRMRNARIFNLCRSYRYQSYGYYVSLLAEARGHKPLPSITTIQDLKSLSMMRLAGDDLEEVIEESLSRVSADAFTLSIYFGRNLARRHDRLAARLFSMFPAPLLRAQFARAVTGQDKGRWQLQSVQPVALSDVPDEHTPFLVQCAEEYFAGKRRAASRKAPARYDLAILYDPDATEKPSTNRTIAKFIAAAGRVGMHAEVISKDDYGKLPEFDALFIRETTAVNHHTYRFARRAVAEGLVVIDDPESIVRCCNKVFLAEALETSGIPAPRTLIVNKDNIEDIPLYVGFPCVLKQPDSAFSMGVLRVDQPEDLEPKARQILAKSDLVIAQEYLPSQFDWRIGVLDSKPIFACKYHMVKGHWQITQLDKKGERDFGKVEAVPIDQTPPRVLRAALAAAAEFGTSLYGVDVKQIGAKVYVIEVNDNPNVDAGYEDTILGDALYDRIMGVFLERLQKLREPPVRRAPSKRPVRLDLSSPDSTRQPLKPGAGRAHPPDPTLPAGLPTTHPGDAAGGTMYPYTRIL